MSTPFSELKITEKYSTKGISAERRIFCLWEDRKKIIRALLGQGQEFGDLGRAPYPDADGVYAVSISAEAFQDVPDGGEFSDIRSDIANYTGRKCLLTITYESLASTYTPWPGASPIEPQSNTFLSYDCDVGGEYLHVPTNGLHWQTEPAAPVDPETPRAVRVPITTHRLTWNHVVSPPWDAMRVFVGCINSMTWRGFAAETLLFEGAQAATEYVVVVNGDEVTIDHTWRLTYMFLEKSIPAPNGQAPYGWNHTWRSTGSTHGFDRLLTSDSKRLYQSVNSFDALFQYPT